MTSVIRCNFKQVIENHNMTIHFVSLSRKVGVFYFLEFQTDEFFKKWITSRIENVQVVGENSRMVVRDAELMQHG